MAEAAADDPSAVDWDWAWGCNCVCVCWEVLLADIIVFHKFYMYVHYYYVRLVRFGGELFFEGSGNLLRNWYDRS